jgi:hypothetical protein
MLNICDDVDTKSSDFLEKIRETEIYQFGKNQEANFDETIENLQVG